MRYFGSKVTAVDKVFQLISARVPRGTLCDPFGGIGTVGSYFKSHGFSVWTGDLLTSAYYFQVAKVKRNRQPRFQKLSRRFGFESRSDVVAAMNIVRSNSGWFVDEYSQKRKFFTLQNARHIESCWYRIASWDKQGLLSADEKAILLASLINSMDKVSNTAGTYYAYLKHWHRKALLPFTFELIPPTRGSSSCKSFQANAEVMIARRKFDVIYLDPPYNERSYSQYYHLPETIANMRRQRVHGKSGIPEGRLISSNFNRPTHALTALQSLIRVAKFRLLAFHYSDQGLISPSDIRKLLSSYGTLQEYTLKSKGYTTTAPLSRTVEHRLYLVSNA